MVDRLEELSQRELLEEKDLRDPKMTGRDKLNVVNRSLREGGRVSADALIAAIGDALEESNSPLFRPDWFLTDLHSEPIQPAKLGRPPGRRRRSPEELQS